MKKIIINLLKDKIGRVGFIGVLIICLIAILSKWIAPYEPVKMFQDNILQSPNKQFLMGTDELGRDILSRVLYGARVSILVGVIAVGISASFGYVFGLISGYFEGWVDTIIMRIMDIIFAFPSIILALCIVSVLGPNIINTMIAIGIVNIPVFTRIVRASVISVKQMEFVTSARAIGVKKSRIIFRHISVNVLASFIVQITLALSGAILTEASMSFLGLGIQPPNPSWGSMLNASRSYMEIAPWTAIMPCIFIVITIFSFNILGDSLRDILDPKLKL
jgi:peptide/nickel transport system permease protein